MSRNVFGREAGHALLVSIAIAVVMAIAATAALTLAIAARYQAAVDGHADVAVRRARDAIERALSALKRDAHWREATFVASGWGWRPWSAPGIAMGEVEVLAAAAGECAGGACLWLRAVGRSSPAARRVEVLAARLVPDDFVVFAAASIRGALSIDGGVFAGECDPSPPACVAIDLLDGRIRAPAASATWVVAHGWLRGSPSPVRVGEATMPAAAIVAPPHDAAAEAAFFGGRRYDPPSIAAPSVASVIHAVRTARANGGAAFVCRDPTGCAPHGGTERGWQRVDLDRTDATLSLVPATKVVVPRPASGVDCTSSSDGVACDAVMEPDARFALVFLGVADPAILHVDPGAAIVVSARVAMHGNVIYRNGFELYVDHPEGVTISGSSRAACVAPAMCASSLWVATTGRVHFLGPATYVEASAIADGDVIAEAPDQRWFGSYVARRVRVEGSAVVSPRAGDMRSPALRSVTASVEGGLVILRWREPSMR